MEDKKIDLSKAWIHATPMKFFTTTKLGFFVVTAMLGYAIPMFLNSDFPSWTFFFWMAVAIATGRYAVNGIYNHTSKCDECSNRKTDCWRSECMFKEAK